MSLMKTSELFHKQIIPQTNIDYVKYVQYVYAEYEDTKRVIIIYKSKKD